MEWDTAAGQAVLEEAGGKVLFAQTAEELTYGRPGFENPGFIVVSDISVIHVKAK